MVKITISFVLAYLLAGIPQVTDDLAADPLHRPMWAVRPTFGMGIFSGATWFARPFIEAIHSNQVARGVAFALLKVIFPLAVTAGFIWCCITASAYLFQNVVVQVAAVAALLIIGTRVVLPWLNLLLLPLTWIVALPVGLLFPLKERGDVQQIRWCQNCKHHRRSERYEDIIRGLASAPMHSHN